MYLLRGVVRTQAVLRSGARLVRVGESTTFVAAGWRTGAIPAAARASRSERALIAEYYQRVFGKDLPESIVGKA